VPPFLRGNQSELGQARTHRIGQLRALAHQQIATGTMSGGEQQMLAIARCLTAKPDLLMFDEPSLDLAPVLVQGLLETIRNLNKRDLTVLLVEQNFVASLKLSNRAYVLENGRIVMSGTGAELLEDDRVRQAYLGVDGPL
jgi:branched-chain amino acid transport system ATP-binding protein